MGSSERQPKQPLPGVFAKAEMPELHLAPFILPCLSSLTPVEIPQASQDQSSTARHWAWNTTQSGPVHQIPGPGPLGICEVAQGLKKSLMVLKGWS